MSVEVCGGAGAGAGAGARPASGLWSLVGWLRRSSSAESVASATSTRTAASFAFLQPAADTAPPRCRPPPSPPTDTYRRRLRDLQQRRDLDRGLTLQAKYNLFDTFSLPADFRDRRATSEGGPRRIAHVPGKRRAPPPPAATLPRRRTRKRPAPRPPVPATATPCGVPLADSPTQTNNIEMQNENKAQPTANYCKVNQERPGPSHENTTQSKVKLRHEKSFFKQLFESKKRHSAVETSPTVRLLPNISELDRQAEDLIRAIRQKNVEENNNNTVEDKNSGKTDIVASFAKKDMWICTRCLKKYESGVDTCSKCVSDKKMSEHTSRSSKLESTDLVEKEKLKVLLKEMKHSLPQRAKSDVTDHNSKDKQVPIKNHDYEDIATDTPTLPIGSKIELKYKYDEPSSSINENKHIQREVKPRKEHVIPIIVSPLRANETAVISQATVLVDSSNLRLQKSLSKEACKVNQTSSVDNKANIRNIQANHHEPLKISTLLNPIYIPKEENEINKINLEPTSISNKEQNAHPLTVNKESDSSLPRNSANASKIDLNVSSVHLVKLPNKKDKNNESRGKEIMCQTPSQFLPRIINENTNENMPSTSGVRKPLDLFANRRSLINQLEQSIARGDEKAAADAAVKLAQLKVSCSVLSFSSHITDDRPVQVNKQERKKVIVQDSVDNETCTRQNKNVQDSNRLEGNEKSKTKVDAGTQAVVKITFKSKESRSDKLSEEVAASSSSSAVPVLNTGASEPSKSVVPSATDIASDEFVNVRVCVEDAAATRGCVVLRVRCRGTLGELRAAAAAALALPPAAQRWIIGRTLAHDDSVTLTHLAGPLLDAPFYLCLVQTESKKATETVLGDDAEGAMYRELVALEAAACVANAAEFECGVCLEACAPGAGVCLRECAHTFCRRCLHDAVRHCDAATVPCPATGCAATLLEREVRGLVSPATLERWLARGLAAAERGAPLAFHCRTPDCRGWALAEPGVATFLCPVCQAQNCLPCKAIHAGESCDKYQARLRQAAAAGLSCQADEGTRNLLQAMIEKGEALECPSCRALIMKKWGCDWVRCASCKTEICWVTRGPRWGPAGRGDVSAGCRCGVDGRRCHPSCTYCH